MTSAVKTEELVKPLNDNVLVDYIAEDEVSTGGVIIPQTAVKKAKRGVILAVGPSVVHTRVGDQVLISNFAGGEIKFDNKTLLILSENDVHAVVKDSGAEGMWFSELLPEASEVYRLQIKPNRLLIRPHKPSGLTKSGLFVERHEEHPTIWAHILAIPETTLTENPSLRPGTMVLYKRHSDEAIGNDDPVSEEYLGQKLPINIVHIRSLEAVIDPPFVPLPI